ncbi:MAG: hypothetical protein QNJ77_14880 [Acidimicrobiia bacterium]|nr:hypothetical protein [Acidimicrobiia bacterium]
MRRLRNVLADVLVGVVLVVAALWLLRGVFRLVYWGASLIVLLILVAVVLRVASKLRG